MILTTLDRIRFYVYRLFNLADCYYNENTDLCQDGSPSMIGEPCGTFIYRDRMERILDEYAF